MDTIINLAPGDRIIIQREDASPVVVEPTPAAAWAPAPLIEDFVGTWHFWRRAWWRRR